MNWVAISAIGDILAAVGLIASLLFVGFQIRRDRKVAEYGTIIQRQTGARELFSAIATSDYLAPITAKMTKDSLTPSQQVLADAYALEPEEAIRMDSYYAVVGRHAMSILQLPMSAQERENSETNFLRVLEGGTPFRVWWEEGKQLLAADIVAEIDGKLQETDA